MRFILIGVAALLALAAALVAALPWLAEPAARAGLRLAALDDVDFERLRLDWSDLEIEGLAVGADQEVRRIQIAWRLPDLLDGRLARVEIEGLTLRAAWRDGSLQLMGLEAADTGDPPPLPIPDVDEALLRDARLELDTGLGVLHVPLSAQLRSTGEHRTFQTTITDARLAGMSASGSFEGEVPHDVPPALDLARLSGSIDVVAERATLGDLREVHGEAALDVDLANGLLRINGSILDATWQGGGFAEGQAGLTAEFGGQEAHGSLDLAVADGSSALDDLVLSGISLNQPLEWRYAAEVLTLIPSAHGALAVDSLAAPQRGAGSLRARLEPTGRPLLELAFADGQADAWNVDAAAVIEALEAHLAAPAPLHLQSQAGTLRLVAEGAGSDLLLADLVLVEGELRLPEHVLALDGITAEAALSGAGLIAGRTLPISIERIRHAGDPAWFAPFALRAQLVPQAEANAFEGTLSRIGGGLEIGVRGSMQPSGKGRARVEVAPVAFGPGLQPGNLAPIAADLVRDVTGQLALSGDLTWDDDGIAGSATVLVDQLGLGSGPARLEQINGVIRLDRLWPPTTPPGQQLAIGLLDLGLPLTAGIATFQLTEGPRLEVEELQWQLAGGTARAEPFSLGSPIERLNVTLRADGLDLGQLLALTRMEGLSGEGSLDGVLPLRVSGGAATIAGGRLAATGPGVLRYATEAAPAALRAGGEGVDLLLQALENFHYEELEITLEGRTDAAMDIALHLAGANPDLYDGHPVEFNLDLEGELANILHRGIASYQIPERIRERMQGFRR